MTDYVVDPKDLGKMFGDTYSLVEGSKGRNADLGRESLETAGYIVECWLRHGAPEE